MVTDFETGGVRVDLAGSIAGNVVLDDGSGLGLRGGSIGGANGQDFTGPVHVREGTLLMGGRDAFGMTSDITIEDGAQVDINHQQD